MQIKVGFIVTQFLSPMCDVIMYVMDNDGSRSEL